MNTNPELTRELQRLVLQLEDDLRIRAEGQPGVAARWRTEYETALARGRTAASWQSWRDDRVTQAAVAWVLTTVFVRFCEANSLVRPVWIAGAGTRSEEAVQAQLAFFRAHPEETDREWLLDAVGYLASLPATANLVGDHSALHLVSPSGDAASGLLDFWRKRGDDGRLVRDFTDPTNSTRFLGDLYQDISLRAKETYALLQTPDFVEEFILDRTLEPALRERPLNGFRMIDPACGSGHFLLGAFARLLDRWHRQAPGMEIQARVQLALDAVHGVDINPFAVAIAQFRLIVMALKECGLRQLEDAPAFTLHLAVGDSLLHGQVQQELLLGHSNGEVNLRADLDIDVALSGFAYSTEDLVNLRKILQPGRYDVVVANPPYITPKDKASAIAYRTRYPSCAGGFPLTVPFMERLFQLARNSTGNDLCGWVGQITSNSFMRREFGARMVETFLARRDLILVADTSGAYIPGHGTPTVILVGRNSAPQSAKVRAVLGVRGEPGRPQDAAKGVVWRSIVDHVDSPGYDSPWITISDLDRTILDSHPWTLTGGAARDVLEKLRAAPGRLGSITYRIGFFADSHADEAFFQPARVVEALSVPADFGPAAVRGEGVRDWTAETRAERAIFPYDAAHELVALPSLGTKAGQFLWRLRSVLGARATFSGESYVGAGREWFEWHQLPKDVGASHLTLSFAFVATHNHFVLERSKKVFNRSAPVIKLPKGASEDQYLGLLGVLNSSAGCFWLKQYSHNKGSQGVNEGVKAEAWERFYEFTGTTLQDFPLPAAMPLERARILDDLAQEFAAVLPSAACSGNAIPSLRGLELAHADHDRILSRMIAVQEELDWEAYRLYGVLEEDLTYSGEDLPEMALGERAFEIDLARGGAAGVEETTWFSRHGATPVTDIPADWPAAYREVVQRRIDRIASNASIRLLERAEYKRRWATVSWEDEEAEALRIWLLDRLDEPRFWFDAQGRPAPHSIGQLADEVSRDQDFVSVLALWERRLDVPVAQCLGRLFADEAVPYLAVLRYTEAGMRKREAWEETWVLQRQEDAGDTVGPIPVPPRYARADFRRTADWGARGKLDVPRERFILYPDAGRDTDPSALLGWSLWDHAQQALALNLIIGQREAEGWPDQRLVPLVAGLAEIQPWVEQWHRGVESTTGVDLAAFCREELARRAAQVGCTLSQLAAWQPQTLHTRSSRP